MACSNVYFHMAKSEYRDDMLKKEMIRTARHCGVAALEERVTISTKSKK